MNQTNTIANLAVSLMKAQRDMPTIGKDASNPEFRSAYATLDKIVETIRPILAGNGLAIVQGAEPNGAQLVVTTRLIHQSGEWIESSVVMPLVGRMLKGGARAELDPQSAGSAVSYGRRYGICALLNLVTGDDDDGNAASAPKRAAAPRPAASSSPRSGEPTPAPEDRVVKGKRLGDMAIPELVQLAKWAIDQNTPRTDALAKDANDVLESRRLAVDEKTRKALGTDDESRVNRMIADEDKKQSALPF